MTDSLENAVAQAKAQVDSIKEMVAALNEAVENDDDKAREAAEQRIHEDALSVEVRSGWHSPGSKPDGYEEFRILLCTGGPAVQIVGDLDQYGQPEKVRLQCQDWFLPWTDVVMTVDEQLAVLTYAQQFYFGE